MRSLKIILGFVIILSVISLCCCVPEEIILHGELSGYVTDAKTSEPLKEAAVELNQSNITTSTTITENDGAYLLKNIRPGDYELQASKLTYGKISKNVKVRSAEISEVNFALNGIPHPEFSDTYLDFGFDSTLKSFTISNTGKGILRYFLVPTQSWINVNPILGEVTTETDTIMVTIDRTGQPDNKHMEGFSIISFIGEDIQEYKVDVLANGIMDQNENYYGIVTIGTQTWMSENLNTGNRINYPHQLPTDNEIVEKYCYDNLESNCDEYGGIYSWYEMMDYNSSDIGTIGSTQGICPAGWHIPTIPEWHTLSNYLGGHLVAGGKLKATGTIEDGDGLWLSPNTGATNESGFTALPVRLSGIGGNASFFGATLRDFDQSAQFVSLRDNMAIADFGAFSVTESRQSVRCVRDP